MLFISEYRIRPNMPKDDVARLMTLFAERGPEQGTIAHYVKTDGTGGIVLVDQDDAAKAYESVLAYGEFLDFTVTPALAIDDAVPAIANFLN